MITEFSAGLPDDSSPQQIAAGPDGDVWFSDRGADTVGRVTSGGTISEDVSGLVQNAGPTGLAFGPDGNLWFADASWYAGVGMITPSGSATEWRDGRSGSVPDYIAAGSDGNMWVTDYSLPAIWKVTLPTSHPGTIGCSSSGGSSSPPGGGGSGPGAASGPRLSRVRESHTRWRKPGGAKRGGVPIGTTFTFGLDAAAVVRFTFIRTVLGRDVDGRCRATTKANRRHRACRGSAEIGVLTTRGRAGRNRVVFRGHLGRRPQLPAGSYAVQITASDAGGASAARTLRFTIRG